MLTPIMEGWRPHLGDILDPPLLPSGCNHRFLSLTAELFVGIIRTVRHSITAVTDRDTRVILALKLI